MFKRLARALIRLRVCAGWSEVLLVAHTKLLEKTFRGSIMSIAARFTLGNGVNWRRFLDHLLLPCISTFKHCEMVKFAVKITDGPSYNSGLLQLFIVKNHVEFYLK